jgi:hypothetical protein
LAQARKEAATDALYKAHLSYQKLLAASKQQEKENLQKQLAIVAEA